MHLVWIIDKVHRQCNKDSSNVHIHDGEHRKKCTLPRLTIDKSTLDALIMILESVLLSSSMITHWSTLKVAPPVQEGNLGLKQNGSSKHQN